MYCDQVVTSGINPNYYVARNFTRRIPQIMMHHSTIDQSLHGRIHRAMINLFENDIIDRGIYQATINSVLSMMGLLDSVEIKKCVNLMASDQDISANSFELKAFYRMFLIITGSYVMSLVKLILEAFYRTSQKPGHRRHKRHTKRRNLNPQYMNQSIVNF